MSKYWFFEGIDLFSVLCPHKYKEFCKSHKFSQYKKNEYIYIQGDVSNKFFLINSGKVKMGFWNEDGEEVVTAYLQKGEIFGEEFILSEPERKEFACSVSNDTSLCYVTISQMEELMKDNKIFATGLYKLMGYKIKKIERRYRIMFFRNTKMRIIEFIKDMQQDNKQTQELLNGEIVIHNPYSQSEVAKLIATSRQTFNTICKELEEDGYLLWQKKKILLKNRFLSEF